MRIDTFRPAVSTAVAAALLGLLAGCGFSSTDTVEEFRPEELAALDDTTTTATTTTEPVPETGPAETPPPPSDESPVVSGVAPSPATTTGPPPSTAATADVTLYFISGSQLVAVDVPIEEPFGERRVLDALAAGPPAAEFAAGIRTAVPADLIRAVRIAGDQVVVDLNGDLLRSIESDAQRPMIAQIVLTLTGTDGFDGVLFTTDGEPLRVYRRDNALSERGEPVTRRDYEELLADNERSTAQ